MQTPSTAEKTPRFTNRLSDRLSHIVAQGWLAEGLILLGVVVMVAFMVQ